MGGFAVCRELKRLVKAGTIPALQVIVVLERDADAWQAGESGADASITQPDDAAEIERLIRELTATVA